MERDMLLKSKGETVRMMLWVCYFWYFIIFLCFFLLILFSYVCIFLNVLQDTAGQEMFAELTRQYYHGAGAAAFVFSTTDRDSFLAIERWKRKVEDICGTEIPCVLVQVIVILYTFTWVFLKKSLIVELDLLFLQNKIDLLDEAKVDPSEVEDLARKLNIKLYRTCVRDNVLVDEGTTLIKVTHALQSILNYIEHVSGIMCLSMKVLPSSKYHTSLQSILNYIEHVSGIVCLSMKVLPYSKYHTLFKVY